MRWPACSEHNLEHIQRWREICPDIAIRSAFIVGFPGETQADFEALLDFLRAARLDRVGCFQYSAVNGAASNRLDSQIAAEVKQARWHQLMQLQQEISEDKLEQKLGLTLAVLIDAVNGEEIIGRSYANAPDIDRVIYVYSDRQIQTGEKIKVIFRQRANMT